MEKLWSCHNYPKSEYLWGFTEETKNYLQASLDEPSGGPYMHSRIGPHRPAPANGRGD